jgi:hypothetical protein
MLASKLPHFLPLVLFVLPFQTSILFCRSNATEGLQDASQVSFTDGPTATIIFPQNGAIISESKWTMQLQFSHFQGLSAVVMFGTGQSVNLKSLDSNFALIISDFENGPYQCTVIMLDSDRNPVGGSGEASVYFIVNVTASVETGDLSATSAPSHFPRRLNAYRQSRSLGLKVLRIALSYSRSIDAKM